MKQQIKNRYTEAVLFECDVPNDVQASGLAMRHALEQAVKAGANLAGANLAGANLAGANLAGAYLAGAYLAGAYLAGANKLIGKRPLFIVGPIGSRNDYFQSFITEKGLLVSAGCFQQKTIDDFRAKLSSTHQDNDHAKEYEMALLMVEAHAAIWTPKEEK